MLNIWLTIIVLAFLIYMLRLVAKREVEMRNIISWLVLCIVALPIIWFPSIIGSFSQFIGIQIFSNFIFMLAIFLLIFLTFTLTKSVSEKEVRIRQLAQKIALDQCEKLDD